MPIYHTALAPVVVPRDLGISTLDLLKIPFLFTQTGLLTVSQFVREAKKRGIRLTELEMEQLRLQGFLVPFYQKGMDISNELEIPNLPQHTGIAHNIAISYSQNQICDPGKRNIRSWSDRNTSYENSIPEVLYSQYQLIALRFLRKIITRATYRRDSNDKIVYDLPVLDEGEQEVLDRFRSLAIVLEALSPRYRHRVMWSHTIPDNMEKEYYGFLQDENPAVESELLSLGPEKLVEQSNELLANALGFDPLGKFHNVIKISNPSRWHELRYDALLAHEQRVAAEILLLFVEGEALQGRSQALRVLPPVQVQADWEPQRDRLKVGDQRERSNIISTYGLSDRPSLYFAVEGETEFIVINRIHKEKGYDKNTSVVRFFDLKSDNKDLKLLAHAVAAPFLDYDVKPDEDIPLLSHPTVLFVVLDPARNASMRDKRSKIKIIDYVANSFRKNFQTSGLRERLQNLIYIEEWEEEFEFAHFSDDEIVEAISKLYTPDDVTKETLIRKVKECRRNEKYNIEKVWVNWDKKIKKTDLIKELWKFLESEICNPSRERCIPILDMYDRALKSALDVRKSTVVSI